MALLELKDLSLTIGEHQILQNISFDVGPKFQTGSPADGKVWTATNSSGNGQWETPSAGGSGTVSSGTTNRLAY